MSELILIRHTATDMAGCFCGHSDPDLNTAGEEQLRRLVRKLARRKIRHVYASDLLRARRAADAIAAASGAEVRFRSGLREIFFGEWEGMQWNEIWSRFPQEAEAWVREFPFRPAPGGERYDDFTARVTGELDRLFATACEVTAVVAHRGVLQFVLTRCFAFSDAEAWQRTSEYGAVVTLPLRPKLCGTVA